jgi:hypothetical protein
MKLSLKQKIAAVAAAATVVGGTGIAVAYWTSTGTGSGSAAAGQATAWAVTTDAAVAEDGPLTPGGPASVVGFHVANDSTGHQFLADVAIKVANADGTAWSSGNCDADDFSVGGELAGATHTISPDVDLAPGTDHDDDVTVEMVNKTDANQDDCKGVIVPLHLAAS